MPGPTARASLCGRSGLGLACPLHRVPDDGGQRDLDLGAVARVGQHHRGVLLQLQGLPDGVGMNHRLVHFQHLFSGSSYAAGYYVYLWAEVLDADGYDAFVEAGDPFGPTVAERLRRFVYSSGGTLEPAAAFRASLGRDPQVDPMLAKRGLVVAPQ